MPEQWDIHKEKQTKKNNLNFMPFTKMNPKLIIDLNVKHKTVTLLEHR